jgi:hypothetical protein
MHQERTKLNTKDVAAIIRLDENNLIFVIVIQWEPFVHHYREVVYGNAGLRGGVERFVAPIFLCDELSAPESILWVTPGGENAGVIDCHGNGLFLREQAAECLPKRCRRNTEGT